MVMNSGCTSDQNSCSLSERRRRRRAVEHRVVGLGQRVQRLPGERGPERRVEREQLEQDRGSGPRRPDDEQRRGDRLGRDARRRLPCLLQTQPRLEDAHHLAARHDAADDVQLRLAVDRVEQATIRLLPAGPLRVVHVVEPGGRARRLEHLVRVEADDARRVAAVLAEQVHPSHPVGVHELLHALLVGTGDDHRAVGVANYVVGYRAE